MRASALLLPFLIAGCLGNGQPASSQRAPETLEYIIRATAQAFFDQGTDYLVDHHDDAYVELVNGVVVNKTNYLGMLKTAFTSGTWDEQKGNATRPEDLWQVDHLERWNITEAQADPELSGYVSHYPHQPDDLYVRVPYAHEANVPQNLSGFYRPVDDRWINVAG